jgi:rhodanese-related sulfurtransferase
MGASAETAPIDVEPGKVAKWIEEDPRMLLIDVREPHEREAGHIDGSVHIELTELSARAESFERGQPIVFYCRVGNRSMMAAQALRASGFDAYSMRGGLARWAQESRELSPEGGYVADH